ncbi:protein tyrosine phosphatase, mitochondrial 1 [Plakobranchus ocellatus]|uniref:Phosphatidylglycerophosphatase and protein-tyrosine phosphatase 1 n=1 Tax=Plakobranchus ocellatus TaxID=259542 RepID=A0AAV4DNW2_9GAST|nr:protein tyrosine phosphatase, mitochondrial 1 [Plakobranchus ocellatus]
MIGRLLFYPTLAWNLCWSGLTARPWYDRLDETVLLGALPLRSIMKTLVEKENVKAMVTMNESYELKYFTPSQKELSDLGIERLHLSTPDLTGTPTLEQLEQAVKFILSERDKQNSVYVHCKAGKTRSATVAACYLMQLHAWDVSTAVAFIEKKRPVIWLRDKQMKSLHSYHANFVKPAQGKDDANPS